MCPAIILRSLLGTRQYQAQKSLPKYTRTISISLVSQFSFFFGGFQNLVSCPITQRINENVSCTARKSAFVHPRKGFFSFFFCFSGVNSAVRIGIQKNEDGSFTNKDEAFKTPHVSDAILDLITCKSRKVGVTPLL